MRNLKFYKDRCQKLELALEEAKTISKNMKTKLSELEFNFDILLAFAMISFVFNILQFFIM